MNANTSSGTSGSGFGVGSAEAEADASADRGRDHLNEDLQRLRRDVASLTDTLTRLAAQVGGIGIAPGANLSDSVAMFEATHGTAPKYAGKDYVNPGSEILSAEMMLRHLGWLEAADKVIQGMEKAIADKQVTYDFARLMEGANEISCSAFGNAIVERM